MLYISANERLMKGFAKSVAQPTSVTNSMKIGLLVFEKLQRTNNQMNQQTRRTAISPGGGNNFVCPNLSP